MNGVGESITLLLSIANKLMDLLPDYEQVKREKFHRLRTKYEEEQMKEWDKRDDNLLGIYRSRILLFMQDFEQEIDREIKKK